MGGGGGGNVGGVEATVSLDTSQVDPALAALQAKLADLGGRLEALGARGGVVEAGMAKAAGGTKNLGMQMLIVGQTVDDLQYGFSAIVNQLPQLAMAFGLGPGLAGAVSVAGVAVSQLIKHWGELTAAFTTSGTLTAAEEMQTLGAKTAKTADEQARYNELKRQEQNIDAQKKRVTPQTGAVVERGGKGIGASPYEDIIRDVVDASMAGRGGQIEARAGAREAAELAAMARGGGRAEMTPERREQIRDDVQAEMRAREQVLARELVEGAQFGSGREQRDLEELARRNPGMRALGAAAAGFARPERGFAPVVEGHVAARRAMLEADAAKEAGLEAGRGPAAAAAGDAEHRAAMGRFDLVKDAEEERQKRNKEALERLNAEGEKDKQLRERGGDLNWRLRQLMDPERQGRSMSLDAYEASIKSRTGETEEVKRLHAIQELLKEIKENNRNIKLFGVKKKG